MLVREENGVATLTLNRPEARNALSSSAWVELRTALERVGKDKGPRVVVLTGARGAFTAGDDIKEVSDLVEQATAGKRPLADVQDITHLIQGVARAVHEAPKPVIAAVNGFALGAGLELVLMCDFAYAAQSATFGFPQAGIGMTLTGGATHTAPRRVTLAWAKELAFTARKVDAVKAKELGIVNAVLPDEELMPAVMAVAEEIKAQSPTAVEMLKRSLQLGAEVSLGQALALETNLFGAVLATEDVREGVRAFKEKRPPRFPGR